MILGVDPGSDTAAAVLLDGRTVVAWACYWRVTDGYRVASHARQGRASILPSACLAVAGEIPGTYAVCCERLFVGASGHSAIVLAEAAGLLLGALAPRATAWLPRPLAVEWRPAVLPAPLPRTAKALERHAIAWARDLTWATGYPEIPAEALGAVSEAAAIGVWALRR